MFALNSVHHSLLRKPTIVTIQNINILVPLLSREKLLCEKRDLSHILKTFTSISNYKWYKTYTMYCHCVIFNQIQ